jgi:hypothetical protein
MARTVRPDPERLYNLLPALYREADTAQGLPLRALLRLVGGQAELLRVDIQQLWDNFFIETCERWAIPYIGDLVANRTLHDVDLAQDAATAQTIFADLAGPDLRPISTIRTRADVAKTIYYRRRKGTAAMLEELAGDVTGWGAHVVEFFQILTWTQNLNHLRLASTGCADLRSVSACARIDGPFDAASHLVDVRAIAQSEGWYNVPNLGFFLWRLESFPLRFVRARAIGGTSWRFTFSPLGNSTPLFARWPRQSREPGMSPELFVPEAIPPAAFFDDLAAIPSGTPSAAAGAPGVPNGTYTFVVTFTTRTLESRPSPASAPVSVANQQIDVTKIPKSASPTVTGRRIYGFKQGVSSVYQLIGTIDDNSTTTFIVTTDQPSWTTAPPLQPNHSLYYGDASDYTDWSLTVYEQSAPGTTPAPVDLGYIKCLNLDGWATLALPNDDLIGIDVKRGRLVVGSQRMPATIYVSYNYGFSAHMGGGPYPDRKKWVVPAAAAEQIIDVTPANTLDMALATWAANPPANTIIRITDNDTHVLSSPLTLNSTKWLTIQAGSADPGFRPHIQPQNGKIVVEGGASGSTLTLDGLLIEGGVEVAQDIEKLRILHCTLVPGRSVEEEAVAPPSGPSVIIDPGTPGSPVNTKARVEIAFSITGPLRIPETVDSLWILDSIVDGASGEPAISNATGANGPRATIERSTILGQSFFRKFDLCSDTIFTDLVTVEQRVNGCLRFSFVPDGSSTPQQYRCQPALEVATQIEETKRAAQVSGQVLPPGWDTKLTASIEKWLVPSFETALYGKPDYCQLRLTAHLQIRTGASDGAEMGAFNQLKQAQRETNLRIRLDEYVPFGRASGIIYVT